MARGKEGRVSRYRTCWWEKQRRRHGGWAESVSVCVCTCVRVSDRGAQYRQLIPTGNTAAALLGQCAIVSFIIITACFPHVPSLLIPPTFSCSCGAFHLPADSKLGMMSHSIKPNSSFVFEKQDRCLCCGRLQCKLKPPENSTPGDCLPWREQRVCKQILHNTFATVNSVAQNQTKRLISNVIYSFCYVLMQRQRAWGW